MNAGFPIPRADSDTAQSKLDLREYLHFGWRHWIFILAVTAISIAVALIYLVRATPLYTASTLVLLEHEKDPGDPLSSARVFDDALVIDNQLAILRSDSLLKRVVLKEKLAPASESGSGDENAVTAETPAVRNAVNWLRGSLSVRRSGQAQVLDIAVTWKSPERAAQLANAVADAFVVDQLEARFESAKRASGWLSDRLAELREQLRASEDAIASFRASHGLVRAGPNVALNDQQLADLNGKLIAARADAAEKKTRVDFLADVATGKKTIDRVPDTFQSTMQSGVMGTLRQKLAEASQREADLLARYSSRHPAVVTVEAEKRDIERSIAAETQRLAESVKAEYALAKARVGAAEQAMREATGQGGLDSEDVIRLRELERTAAVNKSLFEDFLQKAKVTEEQSTFRPRDVRVITPAHTGAKTFPNSKNVLIIALFVGLGLGVAGAIAMEVLNVGFTTTRQVEDALNLPVLASLVKMDKNKLKKDGETFPVPFYQMYFPLSGFSESIRTLRSGVQMLDVDNPPKVVQVTSTVPGEGKSTVAQCLAISAASAGMNTVIVDADLRHPSTTHLFKLDKKPGLVDMLTGAAKLSEVITHGKNNLAVLPAGAKSLNPPDLLGSERMKALIEYLRENFDYVVIDTPPVGPVVDSYVVANLVDKSLYVIRWASTARDMVGAAVQKLSVQKRVGGIVLNLVVQERAKKYGADAYYYGRQYSKYYSG